MELTSAELATVRLPDGSPLPTLAQALEVLAPIEVFIEAKGLNYNCGNALKYLTRVGVKDEATEIEDLKKAEWYLQREIARIQTNA